MNSLCLLKEEVWLGGDPLARPERLLEKVAVARGVENDLIETGV